MVLEGRCCCIGVWGFTVQDLGGSNSEFRVEHFPEARIPQRMA